MKPAFKLLIWIYFLCYGSAIFMRCSYERRHENKPVIHMIPVHDTLCISVVDHAKVDSLRHVIAELHNTVDSLNTQNFIANYKVERVKYYLKICLRNPTQDKFLKGWINRAVQ
jgi:hypothetical protein